MSCGLVAAHEDHEPGSIGGTNVAIAWPNMWLSGSRFRNRIGRTGGCPTPVLRHLALDRDDVGEHVAVGDDDALGLGGGAGREDDLGGGVGPMSAAVGRREPSPVRRSEPPGADRRAATRRRALPSASDVDRVADEDGACASTIAHDLQQEIGRRAVVDRHQHDAFEQAAPERGNPLGAVLAPDDDRPARSRCPPRAAGPPNARAAPPVSP